MNRYTFLIDLGGEALTRTFTGRHREDALELAESSLSDAQKDRVCCVMILAVSPVDQADTRPYSPGLHNQKGRP